MTRKTTRIPLTVMSPGTARAITVHRWGAVGARPKTYFQAGIHADEIPGMLTLHHLTRLLDEADARGNIIGEVVVVPFANPIGLNQRYEGDLLGRYEFRGGGNFNRNYPRLDEAIGDRVEGQLGAEAVANVALIRAAFLAEVEALTPRNEIEAQRKTLMGLAGDADLVFDLHCDSEAVLHLFIGTHLWPEMADLSAQLGSRATMLEIDSGGGSFDEAFSRPWWTLSQRFGDEFPIPFACLSSTVELRGTADVGDHLNAGDADNLFRYLQRRGVVAGDPGALPDALCDATPLAGIEYHSAPHAGIVNYRFEPGDMVEAGDTVAEIIDPDADDPATARTPLVSTIDGVLVGRHLMKFCLPGERVCRVSGAEPLEHPEDWSKLED